MIILTYASNYTTSRAPSLNVHQSYRECKSDLINADQHTIIFSFCVGIHDCKYGHAYIGSAYYIGSCNSKDTTCDL